jgi:hypothetical protein
VQSKRSREDDIVQSEVLCWHQGLHKPPGKSDAFSYKPANLFGMMLKIAV